MTSGNRVEELETQVAELQATVKGLTEELVEANDRIRQLEAALGDEEATDALDGDAELLDDRRLTPFVDDDADPEDVVDDAVDAGTGDAAAGGDEAEAGGSDADRDKGDEDDGGDDGELDDIIVA